MGIRRHNFNSGVVVVSNKLSTLHNLAPIKPLLASSTDRTHLIRRVFISPLMAYLPDI